MTGYFLPGSTNAGDATKIRNFSSTTAERKSANSALWSPVIGVIGPSLSVARDVAAMPPRTNAATIRFISNLVPLTGSRRKVQRRG